MKISSLTPLPLKSPIAMDLPMYVSYFSERITSSGTSLVALTYSTGIGSEEGGLIPKSWKSSFIRT
jgi:hypothetical protein